MTSDFAWGLLLGLFIAYLHYGGKPKTKIAAPKYAISDLGPDEVMVIDTSTTIARYPKGGPDDGDEEFEEPEPTPTDFAENFRNN